MRFDFEAERPPALTEAALQAELEKRQLQRQTAALAAAGILLELCVLLAAAVLFRACLPASLLCMAYAAGTTAGGGMLAVICHERKGDFLWQQ